MKFNQRANALTEWFRARVIPRITAPYWVAHQVRNMATTYVPTWRAAQSRKPLPEVVGDLAAVAVQWRCLPFHYLRYELYIPDHDRQDVLSYIPDTIFYSRILPGVNRGVTLLDDKVTCKRILESAGIPQPELLVTGEGLDTRGADGEQVRATDAPDLVDILRGHSRVVIKPARCSAGGDGIHVLTHTDGTFYDSDGRPFDLLAYVTAWGGWFLEAHVRQSEALDAVNPHSVNTIRVITIDAGPLCCLLKSNIGTGPVDNACHGGLYVCVDPKTGKLDSVARTTGMARYTAHPTSGLVFDGYSIPGIRQVADLAARAARLFPQTPVIGWDIAMTVDGSPVVVEGNSSPSLLNIQRTHGGMAATLGPNLRHERMEA